jgi:riboflavin synthase
MPYMVPKGSVALEGVSLTLARVDPGAGWIEVALIPTTLEKTTLGRLEAGSPVNVEADASVKALIHWARHYAGTMRS